MSKDQGQVLVESSHGSQGIDSYAWNTTSIGSSSAFLAHVRRSTAEKKESNREKAKKENVIKQTEEEAIQVRFEVKK